jgi:hypothetical protein
MGKTFISWHILHQHWCTRPIALPVRRNPQHRSLLLLSQPLPHPRFNLVISKTFSTQLWTLYATNTSNCKWETFLYEKLLNWVFLPTIELCSSVEYPSRLPKPASEYAHAHLLLRLSWKWCSWPVLLPSDTHRKPITSITAVLLPFVSYLLTLVALSSGI